MKAETYKPLKPCKRGHWLRYVSHNACVECTKAGAIKWAKDNAERRYKLNKDWRNENPEAFRAAQIRWESKNLDKLKIIHNRFRINNPKAQAIASAKYSKAHPDKCVYNVVKRKAAKLKRTPAWLTAADYDRIAAMYTEAARLTRETGVVHHVDHYVPLQGKAVSGLHVPDNLQVITASENLKKHSKWVLA